MSFRVNCLTYLDMVEVASSNLVTPTRFESPNLYDWGFFYACNIRAVAQKFYLSPVVAALFLSVFFFLKKAR